MFACSKITLNLSEKSYQQITRTHKILYWCRYNSSFISFVKCIPSRHHLHNTFYTSHNLALNKCGFNSVGPKATIPLISISRYTYAPLKLYHTSQSLLEKNEANESKQNNEDKFRFEDTANITLLLTVISIAIFFTINRILGILPIKVSWERFIHEILPSGEVETAYISSEAPNIALFKLHEGARFNNSLVRHIRVFLPETQKVEKKLREEEEKLFIDPQHYISVINAPFDPAIANDYQRILNQASFFVFLTFLGFLFTRRAIRLQNKSSVKPDSTPKKSPPLEFNSFNVFKMFDTDVGFVKNTNVKFEDVAGMQEAKQEVMELVHFLKDPSRYKLLGAKMPHGCLLTGPPGVGKTMLAKAVATEAGVPFIAKAGSDFVEMIGGLGARRIRQLFEKAREEAPCIIYIDELDALGAARSGDVRYSSASSEKDQTLNQILVEMDGMLSRQHQVIVLASTNRADILDKALLRPGRFDRMIHIDLPNRVERKEILDRHLANVKLDAKPADYSEQLSNETPGMSGADLANICNEAAIYAAREGDDVITKKHLDYALERVTSGAPKSTTSLSPDERHTVCVHEAGHALVGWLLEHTNALAKVSIIPRSKGVLGVTRTVPTDRYLYSQEQLFDNMCMALGGRAAEDIVFRRITHGAQDDLKRVTNMAYAQVKKFGFNSTVGPLSFQDEGALQVRPYSDALANLIDMEVKNLVTKAYDRTRALLEDHKQKLRKISDELLASETLTYDEMVKLIGPPTYGDKKQISSVPFYNESETKDPKKSDAGE